MKAYAKVNVGLDVTGKTDNGYHLLKSVMQQIDLFDEIEMDKISEDRIILECNNANLPCDEHNLAYKAALSMKEKYAIKSGVKIYLKKMIPIAAGMAGGSTDAAAVIKGMNELFDLKLSFEDMKKIGVKLGADIPFCLLGGCALAEGIGEKLTAVKSSPEMYFLIAKPLLDISTKYVYTHLQLNEVNHPDMDGVLKGYADNNVDMIVSSMGNVLESVTASENAIINELKAAINKLGADGVLMSGSGPTVFGIFKDFEKAKEAEESLKRDYSDIFIKAVKRV